MQIAATLPGVSVFLNGEKIAIENFKEYVQLFTDNFVYENVNNCWEVAVEILKNDRGFQQVSFVNSIATTKGGRHVDYVVKKCMTKKLIATLKVSVKLKKKIVRSCIIL